MHRNIVLRFTGSIRYSDWQQYRAAFLRVVSDIVVDRNIVLRFTGSIRYNGGHKYRAAFLRVVSDIVMGSNISKLVVVRQYFLFY